MINEELFLQKCHRILTADRVLIALRFLASGSLYSTIADSHRVSRSSVCRIIYQFTKVVFKNRGNFIRFPVNGVELRRISQKFHLVADFPNVIGCIDGSQFAIKAPSVNEHTYVCRKGYHSINAQFVCDADFIFLDAVVKYPGSAHDSYIFNMSGVKHLFESNVIPSGWLLGDSGYPQLRYLMTPKTAPASYAHHRYNRAHQKTRLLIEKSIGILKARFLCLSHKVTGPLLCTPSSVCRIIVTCVSLHNLARRLKLPIPDVDVVNADSSDFIAEGGVITESGSLVRENLIQQSFS